MGISEDILLKSLTNLLGQVKVLQNDIDDLTKSTEVKKKQLQEASEQALQIEQDLKKLTKVEDETKRKKTK